ncbi:MRG-domain-containing protein [Ephemerocybe angulata]|uniref:MRG-domain-containing protein n=1 Tax=Ephemerocybe angulata TaxID=980116 RepID=A0A8H6M568_9AGAR|nr:MRG-domain-containing protein [Tulosesus angulatus]
MARRVLRGNECEWAADGAGGRSGTKMSRDKDNAVRKPEMKLAVPQMLNRQLTLKEFVEHVVRENPPNLKDPNLLLPTITSGLQCYLDKAFDNNLLYHFERKRSTEAREKYKTGRKVIVGVTESEVFGAEHFLRMMVSLPGMIAQSALDPASLTLLKEYANELLQYMAREDVPDARRI